MLEKKYMLTLLNQKYWVIAYQEETTCIVTTDRSLKLNSKIFKPTFNSQSILFSNTFTIFSLKKSANKASPLTFVASSLNKAVFSI
jgi:hypothetical protein